MNPDRQTAAETPVGMVGGPAPVGPGRLLPSPGWTVGKLVWVSLLTTGLQAGIVLLLAQVSATGPGRRPEPVQWGWVWGGESGALVSGGGFGAQGEPFSDIRDPFQRSARAALPRPQYQFAEWSAPARWLSNSPVVLAIPKAPAELPPRSLDVAQPRRESPLPTALLASQTTVQVVGGGLADRAWERVPTPGSWEAADLPGTTRVAVRVNPQGWVITARVVSGSGSAAADEAARAAVAGAQFRPLPGAARRPGFQAADLVAGEVVIHWHTRLTVR
jgi:TonB family protein